MRGAKFDEAIRNNPNDANAYYGRALARTNKGMQQDAMMDLQKALDDSEKSVRIASVRALKKIERADCIPVLFNRLSSLGFESADAEAEEIYVPVPSPDSTTITSATSSSTTVTLTPGRIRPS